ncbi:MAG: tRNA (adenosine(37)-N6)-threonylcarbamoyltransferase complex dimerization subunit type 1 TsaB [Gemmataceae bacterium]
MANRWLVLETSGRFGQVGVGAEDCLVEAVSLDASRQHARDLLPAIHSLLKRRDWKVGDLTGIAVSIGPGSYTGLRIGIMAAKAIAYATGCAVAAVPTFAVFAHQSTAIGNTLEVVADALKGRLYCQTFERTLSSGEWSPTSQLRVAPVAECTNRWTPESVIVGPGAAMVRGPGAGSDTYADTAAQLRSVLALGMSGRYQCADVFALEPLYVLPSSAEEQWQRRG